MKRERRGAGAPSRKNRINEEITVPNVRLIGPDGSQIGIVSINEALDAAYEVQMDLVEIAADAEPPVCRVMDYGKHIFEEKKQKSEAKKKQKQIQVKEVKFRPVTDEGDYQVKLRNLKRFLSEGDKAKVTLRFRGREVAHQEIAITLLRRVESDLEEFGTVEQQPEMEGKQMIMVLGPKKRK